MRGMAGLIGAAALLVPGAARARPVPQDFCGALERAIEIAQSDGDFSYLERSRAAPPHFGFLHGCRASAAAGSTPAAWECHQSLAPDGLSLASLAGRIEGCRPDAVRTRDRGGRQAVFTLPQTRILIRESGGPRAKVGRIVTLRIEAVRD